MVKSFRGKEVNMLALAKKHEMTIALGNGPTVNTRGDLIGRNGKVLKTREEQIREYEESLKSQEAVVSMKDPKAMTALERTIEKYSAKAQKIAPKKVKAKPVEEPKSEPVPEPKKEENVTWDE